MNKIFTFMRESSTARFFIPLGLILIAFGVIVLVINMKNHDYIITEATVSNVELIQEDYTGTDENHVDETYSVTVKYTVDGKDYNEKLDNVSKYNVGDKMTIYYNPKDPSQISQSNSFTLPIIMILGGIASLTGGLVSLVNVIKRHKKMKEQERSWTNGQ